MHVLIVNQYALPAGAAGITRHGDLGVELRKRGHEVTVIASRFHYLTRLEVPPGDTTTEPGGVVFRWLSTGSYRGNDRRRLRSMISFTVRSVIDGLRLRRRPQVVIGSSPHLFAGISAWALARIYRVPFVFEIRDPWPSALVDLGAVQRGSRAHRTLEFIERFLCERAERIITVMSHGHIRVSEVGVDASKCVHIPNASQVPDTSPPLPPSVGSIFEAEATSGRTLILYAGAHGVSNGLSDVIDAFDILRRDAPGYYERLAVLLVGSGPEKPSLEARALRSGHANVRFHDSLTKPEMIAAMERADFVLVHFAKADFKRYGMSANKLFDAMAASRPVLVATPLDDTPVDQVRCGLTYEPGSPEALAEALRAAVDTSPQDRRAMGLRGKQEMIARYSLAKTGERLERMLLELVEAP